jgi:D-arabinose 1-dehydrogenase-like Zn-dependent alcohol dehydrogenase
MEEDYSRRSENYDIIVDAIGNASVSRSLERLTENGRLLLVAANVLDMMKVPVPMVTSSKRIIIGPAAERVEDIRLLGDLASKGLLLPTVDVNFRLEDIVEAHRYVDTGRKKGSVVIEVV